MSWLSRVSLSLKHRLHRKYIFHTVKSMAKTQLRTFYALQGRFPNLPNEELYYHTIMTRPGNTEEAAKQVLEDAKQYGDPLRCLSVSPCLRR